jgi:phosphomethylpyrimidine kinase
MGLRDMGLRDIGLRDMGDCDGAPASPAEIPPIFRDSLCPLADIITPNHFEFEWLCGAKATTIDEVIKSARALSARGPSTVVVTGAQLADTPADRLDTVAIEGSSVWRLSTPKLPICPSGTGDLFSALFVSSLVRGSDTRGALEDSVSATFAVLERTVAAGTKEMRIVESASLLPLCRFKAILFRAWCAQQGRDRDLVTAPSIPNASPPIFDAFGLGGGALQRRDPVALSLLHEALTIVEFGPGAYTIVRTFAPIGMPV